MPESMKIYDNFLSKDDHNSISEILTSNNFPWYATEMLPDYHHGISVDPLDNLEFFHNFYENHFNVSQYIEILYPILKKINPKSIIRIRALLIPRRSFLDAEAYHVDMKDFNCRTAIYYVNTNNGFTKFKNGEKIESIANRFIEFDSNEIHTGSFTTDSKYRILINFNYF